MRKTILICTLLLTFVSKAADTTTIFYDQDWEKTRKASNASFYRKIYKVDKKKWEARDYFIDGKIQMAGTFTSKKGKKRTGKFTYYHKNGQIESVGNYVDDDKEGEWKKFHENGQLLSRGKFESWVKVGQWDYYYDNGKMERAGSFVDGELDGEWSYYFESGRILGKIEYKDGEDVKVQYWSEKGVEQKEDLELFVLPTFVGGQEAMSKFIAENFIYPEKARMMGQQGTVYVEFVVTKYGFLEDIKVVKSAKPLLDEEAKRVIELMPDWKPGKHLNKPLNVRFTVPIKCRLG